MTHPRPGKEVAAKCRYPDPQTYLLTPDHTQGPHMPSVKTGLKHPTEVTANKAHQEKQSLLGKLFMLTGLEVCQAPPKPQQAAA